MKRKMIVNNWQSWLKIGLVAVSAVVFALFWLCLSVNCRSCGSGCLFCHTRLQDAQPTGKRGERCAHRPHKHRHVGRNSPTFSNHIRLCLNRANQGERKTLHRDYMAATLRHVHRLVGSYDFIGSYRRGIRHVRLFPKVKVT